MFKLTPLKIRDKDNQPMRAAKMAQISTAPAAMSFTSPAIDGSPGIPG